jgi:hypothetical protein
VQDPTLRGEEPPNPPAPSGWATEPREWRVRIVLDRAALPPEALADPPFWYVGFHDAYDAEIHREDAFGDELRQLLCSDARELVIERQFSSARRPTTWTVWPVDFAGNWLAKSIGFVDGITLIARS